MYQWLYKPNGSPPHTWGILDMLLEGLKIIRFTPTYMGNTDGISPNPHICPVHPHIHGEYVTEAICADAASGSPPHTWGILAGTITKYTGNRFTPTYMGNTCTAERYLSRFPVHPHIHGEYEWCKVSFDLPSGSPPHTWGIHPGTWTLSIIPRFTPTYMGNTRAEYEKIKNTAVHPHIHGEYPTISQLTAKGLMPD